MSFEVEPTGVIIGKGQTAKFDCVVTGGKNTRMLWSFGSDTYDKSSTSGRIRMDSKNSLIITNIEKNDMKKVRCIAEDDKSIEYSKEVLLTVTGKVFMNLSFTNKTRKFPRCAKSSVSAV